MLCQSDNQLCIEGFYASDGGFIIAYTNGIIDFIARSDTSPYYVGVMRSANSSDFRCFSNVDSSPCTAPPNAAFPPQSVPQIMTLTVASSQDALSAENSDGSPNHAIAGASLLTGPQPVTFGIYHMDPSSCQQTYEGNDQHTVYAVFVQDVNFGGDLGVKDAVAIDEYEAGPTPSQDHVERYYYVAGYGRVREGSASYNPTSGRYDVPLGGNSVRNLVRPSAIAQPQTFCPQGTAPLQQ